MKAIRASVELKSNKNAQYECSDASEMNLNGNEHINFQRTEETRIDFQTNIQNDRRIF